MSKSYLYLNFCGTVNEWDEAAGRLLAGRVAVEY